MKIQAATFFISAATLTGAFLGATAYSPYLIYKKINIAVRDLDAETFNNHIDYASLPFHFKMDTEALLRREFKKDLKGVELEEMIAMTEKYLDNGLSNLALSRFQWKLTSQHT